MYIDGSKRSMINLSTFKLISFFFLISFFGFNLINLVDCTICCELLLLLVLVLVIVLVLL